MSFDFIIIGSGLAGLTSALILKDYGSVLIITKGKLSDGATNLAQGGIAAVTEDSDSFTNHINDTLIAGIYHNNKKAVEYVVNNAPFAIGWLENQGVNFEKENTHFLPTREAAHSYKRILHVTDFTGREIEKALIQKVLNEKKIHIWEDCFASDLLVKNGVCYGVKVIGSVTDKSSIPNFSDTPPFGNHDINESISTALQKHESHGRGQSSKPASPAGRLVSSDLYSKAVILATGGLGQLYQWTTNPKVATGDGVALAYRAGAKVKDLEFIQFHPTALRDGESPLFLLSEALRGEGAYLIKSKIQNPNDKSNPKSKIQIEGERFMDKYDEKGELAPRDVVARAIISEQQKGHEVYLDIRHKGKEFLIRRFPNIYKELKKRGLDLSADLIPVTPAAHYSCGGVEVDLFGRTNIKNLFSFGEVSCSGVHGANRLASNSLLEAVVFPLRLKNAVMQLPVGIKHPEGTKRLKDLTNYSESGWDPSHTLRMTKIKRNLKILMWEKTGIVRTVNGLQEALNRIEKWNREMEKIKGNSKEIFELKNMLLVAKLIVGEALKRKNSLGAHFIT